MENPKLSLWFVNSQTHLTGPEEVQADIGVACGRIHAVLTEVLTDIFRCCLRQKPVYALPKKQSNTVSYPALYWTGSSQSINKPLKHSKQTCCTTGEPHSGRMRASYPISTQRWDWSFKSQAGTVPSKALRDKSVYLKRRLRNVDLCVNLNAGTMWILAHVYEYFHIRTSRPEPPEEFFPAPSSSPSSRSPWLPGNRAQCRCPWARTAAEKSTFIYLIWSQRRRGN